MKRTYSGQLLQDEEGQYYFAYYHEQEEAFKKLNKLFVHYMRPDWKPVTGDKGAPKKGLKSAQLLKRIGFFD